MRVFFLASFLFLASGGAALGWGGEGHSIIARQTYANLDAPLRALLIPDFGAFEQACLDPDRRKGRNPAEGPRHYVGVERFGTDGTTWPWARADVDRLFAAIPKTPVQYAMWRARRWRDQQVGTLFYAIAKADQALSSALAEGSRRGIERAAGDLCHYVGDLAQPLHTTINYQGRLSSNVLCSSRPGSSVHERFETQMVHSFRQDLERRVEQGLRESAGVIPNSNADTMTLLLGMGRISYGAIDAILTADRQVLPTVDACHALSKSQVARELYSRIAEQTVGQLTLAVQNLALLFRRAAARN